MLAINTHIEDVKNSSQILQVYDCKNTWKIKYLTNEVEWIAYITSGPYFNFNLCPE